ncbi:MAG: hypothetical protein IT173_08080 [Acidobacteria bacterium]|nr:hypothetical protein [Acidobacteriota bacterium]
MDQTRHRPLIIAHRGASSVAPENTIDAFRKAIDAGADGIEFDVRLARDGVPVVIHDRTLKRTNKVDLAVSDLTSKELAAIDVGNRFAERFKSTGQDESGNASVNIPTLAATLEFLCDFKGEVFIELKCGLSDLVPLTVAVCDEVRNSRIAPQVIVKSFRLAVIPRVHAHAPGVRTAALFEPKVTTLLRKRRHLVEIAAEIGANELSVHYSLATRNLMERARKHGIPVTIWTADNPRWVERARSLGLKAIITNDPARLLARREELTENE